MTFGIQIQLSVRKLWVGIFQLMCLYKHGHGFILEVLTVGEMNTWDKERSLFAIIFVPKLEQLKYDGLIQLRLLYLNFTIRKPRAAKII